MVSRKLMAPALAGTGAAGASGTLAWTLSLFDGESLESKREEKKEPAKPEHSASLQGSSGGPGGGRVKPVITKLEIKGTTPTSSYFSSQEAYDEDKQVIKESMEWKIEWIEGEGSVYVKAGGDENDSLWKCRLRHTSIKKFDSKDKNNLEFIRQGGDLIEEIEKNSNHKEKFVENCSKSIGKNKKISSHARLSGEIELETEEVNGKVRFKESGGYFKKLWTEDFIGVDKLSEEDEELVKERGEWNIEEAIEVKGKTRKVKISLKNKGWFCSISGNYSGNLGGRKFKSKEFKEEILELNKYSWQNEIEWKKYLFRNCAKNRKEITGLTIRLSGSKEWEFSDLKKITERMYTNPTAT